MKNILVEENIIKKQPVFDISLDKSCENIYFEIGEDFDTIKISWKNNMQFFMFYLYGPDGKLYGQMAGMSKEGSRCISIHKEYTSPCCLSPENSNKFTGKWRLEYAMLNNKFVGLINIELEAYEINPIKEHEAWEEESFIREYTEHEIIGKEKQWFSGDFHTHTIYSDGKMTREENNEIANRQSLDFYCPTDHNVYHYSWPKSKNILIIPGIEITSSLGHVNLLFSKEMPFDRHSIVEIENEDLFIKLIKEAENYSIPVINHPFMPPWDFLAKNFPLKDVKFMEIINDPTYPTSKKAINTAILGWNYLLNDGYKVIGIGGSDSHLKPDERYKESKYPSLLGDPKTYIFAEENSDLCLKKAMAEGDVLVSRSGMVSLDFPNLQRENLNYIGKIRLGAKIESSYYNGLKLSIHWILNGKTIKIDQEDKSIIELELDYNYHWIRVDIRDEDNNLCGFTNPIFFNRDKSIKLMKTWGDLMEKLANED